MPTTLPVAVKLMGLDVHGTVLQGVTFGGGDGQTWRTHFAGVNGVSEIRGELGARPIAIPVLLHKRWAKHADLWRWIDVTLANHRLQHGQVLIKGATTDVSDRDLRNCTFDNFDIAPQGLLKDEAGTLDGGWFVPIVLNITQLIV